MERVICKSCQEVTPHIDNGTTGMCCQVCLTKNPYPDKSTQWTDKELAFFWQMKFYEARGSFTICWPGNAIEGVKPIDKRIKNALKLSQHLIDKLK